MPLLKPEDVTKARQPDRDKLAVDKRQLLALEQITDTLECIRAELLGLQHVIAHAPSSRDR